MSDFKVPEVDWSAVEFPIEGQTKAGVKVRLLMKGPNSDDLFGETLDGVWNQGPLKGQESWGGRLWYPDGTMHDVGQWDDAGDLEFRTFGKLPRKAG